MARKSVRYMAADSISTPAACCGKDRSTNASAAIASISAINAELAAFTDRQTAIDASLPGLEGTDSTTRPPVVNLQDGPIDFNALIDQFETQMILQAMRMTAGNKKEAARLLNLKRTTLLEKIKKKELGQLWDD